MNAVNKAELFFENTEEAIMHFSPDQMLCIFDQVDWNIAKNEIPHFDEICEIIKKADIDEAKTREIITKIKEVCNVSPVYGGNCCYGFGYGYGYGFPFDYIGIGVNLI